MKRMTIRGDRGVYMAPEWDFHIDSDDYDLVQKILDRLAVFEDLLVLIGMEPREFTEAYQRTFNEKALVNMITHYLQINPEEAILAMRAGARAIVNNKRLEGATYVWDFRREQGGPKEITYYAAAMLLAETADKLFYHPPEGDAE